MLFRAKECPLRLVTACVCVCVRACAHTRVLEGEGVRGSPLESPEAAWMLIAWPLILEKGISDSDFFPCLRGAGA